VTVFEALPVVGGMMRVGIPRHRLPLEVLDREIEEIKGAGITIKTDTKIESVAKLFDDGYKAVLVAVGAHLGQKLPIHGADLEGILINTDFLRDVSLGKEVKVGEKVVVLGGGNVAFDCARTALRLGAKDVHIACLEDAEKMLATPDECGWGGEEGITVHNSQTFTKILGENGKVSGVECLDVKSFGFDKEGKLNVETVPGSEHVLPADTIIFAIGQLPELKLTEGVGEIKTTQKRTLEVNEETMATGQASVFAAGDAVTGTTSVIEAIAAGRKAASSIDKYLGGQGDIEETLLEPEAPNPHLGREESFADEKRITVPCLPLQKRLESFDTVELGLGKEEATNEAGRCLRCDLRLTFHKPTLAPKEELWVELSAENISQCPEKEGVYQLLDKDKNVIYIKGATNLRQALEEQLQSNAKAAFFLHEAEPMYTKRESELLQQYMAQHGQMPEGNRELDDLF
ncbi:MAG: FAD-dependent oxidoreductase, partial [Dehalococcoidia bacterium]